MLFESKKRIEELETEISELRRIEERLRTENSKLKRQLDGERIESAHCRNCSHAIRTTFSTVCELNCKCKDYRSVREG